MLLKQREHLQQNLSSAQLIGILDSFLYRAISPIFERCPDFALQWVCDLLCVINTMPHKRKFSVNLINDDLSQALGRVLTCPPSERIAALRHAALDRIYLITFVSTFLRVARRALPDPDADFDLHKVARHDALRLLGAPTWAVEPLINKVELYDRLSDTFVSYISEKYVKLAQLRTKAMINGCNLKLSEKDLNANHNMVIVRAIYKYSSQKGTLTDFVQTWMRSNNNPRFAHEFGLAYTLPQSKRKVLSKQGWVETGGAVMNLASPLEDAEGVASDISGSMLTQAEDDGNLQFLYKCAAMLRDDAQVRFYMKAFGFPDLRPPRHPSFNMEQAAFADRVNELGDLKDLAVPPPRHPPRWRKVYVKDHTRPRT